MKVAIVTLYYKTYNYGAQLQAYALQKKLALIGFDAEVLNYRWCRNSVIRSYERSADYKTYKNFEKFSESISHSREFSPETIRESVDDYDAFICGSDQIWSKIISLRYVLPQLALSFVPQDKLKFSYAASMGGAALMPSAEHLLKPYIQELDAVSVREKSAVPYISALAGKPTANVLDPTMLLTTDDWDRVATTPSKGKYVFFYCLNMGQASLQPVAEKVAAYLGCKLRSAIYSQDNTVGPEEWVGLIKNAEYVVTNSFHAIAFSILYHKQFIVAGSAVNDATPYSRNVRATDLLEMFNLSSRYIEPLDFDFKAYTRLNAAIDYAPVDEILKEMREYSENYINSSLAIKKTAVTDAKIKDNLGISILNSISDPFRDYLRCVDPSCFEAEYKSIKNEFEKEKNSQGISAADLRRKMNAQLASVAPDFPLGKEYSQVVIYGAGEVGRAAANHFGKRLLCFVDRATDLTNCCGFPVYRLNDEALKTILHGKSVVFIVTPVWDFAEIDKAILTLFPACSAISMETVLSGLDTAKPEPRYTDEVNAQIVLALLKSHNVQKIVVSPGTTNIPIAWGAQYDPFFEVYSVIDERSAAYFACGLAEQSGEKVALSCTGATASRNYLPGLTEAYYRKLPIIAITSMTDIETPGNLIPQNIDRSSPPNDVCRISVTLPTVKGKNDYYKVSHFVNKAILEAERAGGGPVHLNLETAHLGTFNTAVLPEVPVIRRYTPFCTLPKLPPERIAFFVGAKRFTKEESMALSEFCELTGAVVLCDHASGYHGKHRVDASLVGHNINRNKPLSPELVPKTLIHIGEVSAAYPIFKICRLAEKVWRVSEDGEARDQFKKLTAVFEMPLTAFLGAYTKLLLPDGELSSRYYDNFMAYDQALRSAIGVLPFSNIWIAKHTAELIPENSKIHLGILNTVRAWNLFPMKARSRSINTGGFGIDGTLSACAGSASADRELLHICVLGDLAFFYDMNICGNRHISSNLRIMLVNNGEGTEFRNYSHIGAKIGENAKELISAAGHNRQCAGSEVSPACAWARSLGFRYLAAGCKEQYLAAVADFLKEESDAPILFEVFTTPENESEALSQIDRL